MGFKQRDALTTAVPGYTTYTRSGVGTRYNSSGVETDIAADNPRYTHNRLTPFAPRGVLIESQRTNNLQRSLDLANAYWNATTNVAPAATSGGYDGSNTAFTFTDANGVSMGSGFSKTTGLGTALTNACFSMRMKYVSRRYYEFAIVFASGTKRIYFDLQTGAFLNSGGGAFTSGGMEPEGDGWYRCWCYLSGAQTVNQIYVVPRGALNSTTITGNGSVALAQRPQLEAGTFPSSTINTTSAALTRGADSLLVSDPPVDTSQPFAMLCKYSTGGITDRALVFEPVSEQLAVTDSTNCVVVRFDGAGVVEQSYDGVMQGVGGYDPLDFGTMQLGNGNGAFLEGSLEEIQWWEGPLSDSVGIASAAAEAFPSGLTRQIVRPLIRPLTRPLLRPLNT